MADVDCGHMTCRTWVTITWQSGTSERHRCYEADIHEGVLRLHEAPTSDTRYARCVPLANVREYTIKEGNRW